MIGDKRLEIRGADEIALFAEGVLEIKLVDPKLIGHYDVAVVRHAARDPMVTADRFHPPDFVSVGKGDAVHFVGAELFEEAAEAQHAFPRACDVGQHEGHKIFFADAAGFFDTVRRRVSWQEMDQRICAEHPFVGSDGFGRGHRDVGGIDAGRVGHAGVAHRVVRQINFDVA